MGEKVFELLILEEINALPGIYALLLATGVWMMTILEVSRRVLPLRLQVGF